jgi:dTDP-4-amino-4,6-dideoxygalactose transaminase
MKRWPIYDEEQICDVVEVLRRSEVNAWTGEYVQQFESAYAEYLGRKHTVAVANGTVALDLALRSLGIGAGDEVIVTPRSFVASAACVPFAGATPVFADVDRASGNLTAETIAPHLTPATKAVILVHLAGWPCDIAPIMDLATRHGFKVIEDCAQAHGARYAGRPVGSIGDVATFSFCQDKIITTGGEGGLLATNDAAIWSRAWSLKDHGKSFELTRQANPSMTFRWLHTSIGTNWRMMSIQAALGLRQLRHLDDWQAVRARNAALWAAALDGNPLITVPSLPAIHTHAWYRFYAYVRPEMFASGWTRDDLVQCIAKAGVPCYSGSCSEIYLEDAFKAAGLAPSQRLPIARELGETSLCFLVDPSWSVEELGRDTAIVQRILSLATREAEAEEEDLIIQERPGRPRHLPVVPEFDGVPAPATAY